MFGGLLGGRNRSAAELRKLAREKRLEAEYLERAAGEHRKAGAKHSGGGGDDFVPCDPFDRGESGSVFVALYSIAEKGVHLLGLRWDKPTKMKKWRTTVSIELIDDVVLALADGCAKMAKVSKVPAAQKRKLKCYSAYLEAAYKQVESELAGKRDPQPNGKDSPTAT